MNFEFDFTVDKLAQCVKNPQIEAWFDALNKHLPEFDITTVNRVAGFISQCQHESADFKTLVENLNYSSKGLMGTWPKRFTGVADHYHRKPEMIANRAYADRMGNGPEESGDGWRYRGRGLLQVTGKDNYTHCSHDLFGDDRLVEDPDLLSTPEFAVLSACWFWKKNNLNAICDAGDVKLLTRRINGGTLGLEDRIHHWNDCINVFESDM